MSTQRRDSRQFRIAVQIDAEGPVAGPRKSIDDGPRIIVKTTTSVFSGTEKEPIGTHFEQEARVSTLQQSAMKKLLEIHIENAVDFCTSMSEAFTRERLKREGN